MTPHNAFVAMFDLLGFKERRKALGTAGLYTRYHNGVRPMIEHAAAEGRSKIEKVNGVDRYVPDRTHATLGFLVVSDSALIFAPDDSFASFQSITQASFVLLQAGFGMRMPFRGAIGWGDLINDGTGILIGSAIEDAYAAEAGQAWGGGRLSPAAEEFVRANGYIEEWNRFHDHALTLVTTDKDRQGVQRARMRLPAANIPLQRNPRSGPTVYDTEPGIAVNWTLGVPTNAALKGLGTPTDPHAARIAENTQAFEAWARAQPIAPLR